MLPLEQGLLLELSNLPSYEVDDAGNIGSTSPCLVLTAEVDGLYCTGLMIYVMFHVVIPDPPHCYPCSAFPKT